MFGTNTITGQKYFKDAPKDSLFVTSMFFTLQGEGPYAGQPALFIRLTKCNLTCSFCFVPTTEITMANGSKKRIDEIKVGDQVMAWSGEKFEGKQVTRTYESIPEHIVRIEAGGKPVWCTPEHPFLTSNRGWINAGELLEGDKLVHFGNSAYMKMFNPQFDSSNHGDMSQESKDAASIRLEEKWNDKDFREANVKRMTGDGNPMKDPAVAIKGFLTRENQEKSGLEIKVENICKDLPIKFVGNGALIISYKSPDFVVEGQKKVIEVWADDSLWVKKAPRNEEWMNKRRELFAKEGYDTLFLPLVQSDLKKSEQYKIREKVAAFINNGKIVKNVTKIEKGTAAWTQLFNSKDADGLVYNLEVEDHHTYIANGCVVHNCDTFFDDGEWMTFDEIEKKAEETICKYWTDRGKQIPEWVTNRSHHPEIGDMIDSLNVVLVMTGGEPLLQTNIVEFLNRQTGKYKELQIESNGTVNQDLPLSVTLVCSPKCSEKGNVAIKYLNPTELILNRADCLKFVMSADPTSPYSEVPQWAHEWKKNNPGKEVYVSPMNIYNTLPQTIKILHMDKGGITMDQRSTVDETISFWEPGLLNLKANQDNHEYTARYCMDHGFKLNLQMHLYASLA